MELEGLKEEEGETLALLLLEGDTLPLGLIEADGLRDADGLPSDIVCFIPQA